MSLCHDTQQDLRAVPQHKAFTVLQHLRAPWLCPAQLPVGAINLDTGTSHSQVLLTFFFSGNCSNKIKHSQEKKKKPFTNKWYF